MMALEREFPPVIAQAVREMTAAIASGEATLFTGAGFSAGALDGRGRPLPDAAQMRAELWRLVFGDDEQDDSSLQDLYDVALERIPDELTAYLQQRLRVGDAPLPAHYATWFAAPWRRIYTLNVDDLEAVVQQQYTLPRRLVSASRAAPPDASAPGAPAPIAIDELDVVHLNGLATHGAQALTFSTFQYAARLCGRDRDYEDLANDMARASFVFAGTTLDEMVLWRHVEMHRQRGGDVRRPPSWLLARSLSRARQLLLHDIGVCWLPLTIEAAAPCLPRWAPA
jgi:hypothetical protein